MNNTTLLIAAVVESLLPRRSNNTAEEHRTEMNTTVQNVKNDIADLPSNTALEEYRV